MSAADPPWAHEKPELRPHDPQWAGTGQAERDRLAELLAPWLVDGVEHVGSTSVPGLAAKPVIDLMASVGDLGTTVDQAAVLLARDGWCYVPPELDQRPYRRFFVKPDPAGQHRLAHLHVLRAGHPRWAEQIVFRDALRGDGELVRRYAGLKRELAARHPGDREAYTAAKTEFVAEVLRQAPGSSCSAGS